MNKLKVYLASKRAPLTYQLDPKTNKNIAWLAPGGTANVVADMASYLEIDWTASAMTNEDRQAANENPEGLYIKFTSEEPIHLYLLQHEKKVFDSMQYRFTSDLMWASNNYLWDSWTQPSFDESVRDVWSDFLTFTNDFTNIILKRSEKEKEPIYLIHDYQLVCVPERIRKARPTAPMLLFVHIPWPSADYWRMMPKYVRTAILEGMLGASSVAFFAHRWVTNFLACVADLIPKATIHWETKTISYQGRTIRVEAMPLGYSPQAVSHRKPKFDKAFEEWIGDRPLVLHSGRTDPMKNAIRAIQAYLLAVQKNPILKNSRLLVRTNPNRLYVEANNRYFEGIKDMVNHANETLGEEAVRMVLENDVDATFGCMERADLFLYNSTVDGQNLTVFESPLVNKRHASVILSERCGAAEALKDVCTLINPFDLAEQADAIHRALTMSAKEREITAKKRIEVSKRFDLPSWVDMQLNSLGLKRD